MLPVDSRRVTNHPDSERSSRHSGRSETQVSDNTAEAANSQTPATFRSNERPPAKIVPGSPSAVREIAYHQRNLGNRATQRFVGSPTIARKVEQPPEAAPQTTSANQEAAAGVPTNSFVAGPPQAAPPEPPGQPAGSSSSVLPSAPGGSPSAGGSGPLDFLNNFQGASPSDLSKRLASAGQAAGTAMGGHKTELEGLLPPQPAPSGMPPGTEVAAPDVPDVPQPDANASTDDTADPGAADHLGGAGSTAVGQLASGANIFPPDATQTVRPTVEAGELPAIAIDAPQPISGEAPAVHADGATQKALDANLGSMIREQIAAILAPASAAGVEHAAATTATHTDAKKHLSTAEASTKSDQESATSSADTEIRQLLANWGKEKTSIVGQHQTAIQSESQQVKAAASQTMAEANAQARTKAAEAEKSGENAEPSGLWDRVKAVGKSVVAGIGNVVGAAVGVIKGIIDSAREKVVSLISRLKQVVTAAIDRAVNAIRQGVQRVAGAVTSALRKAQALVTRLAKALVSQATKIWQAAAQKLKQLWNKLQSAIKKALSAVRKAVQLVAKAVGMIREILKVFGNKTYAFIADLLKDPQGKIVAPIVAKAAPLAAGVPAKAEDVVRQHGPAVETQAPVPASTVASPPIRRSIRGVIQRAPAPAPPGEGFWEGVWRHMKGAGADFASNWPEMLAKIITGILAWFPMLIEELPLLWTELKGLFVGTKDGMDRLDHLIGVCRHIVNIVAGTFATVGVYALLFAWLGGPIAEGFTLAGYEAISAGIIAADIIVSIAQMTKSAAGATRSGVPEQEREGYLSRFVGGGIGFAVTIVMVVLGAIAQQLAKGVRAMKAASLKAAATAAEDAKAAKAAAAAEGDHTKLSQEGGLKATEGKQVEKQFPKNQQGQHGPLQLGPEAHPLGKHGPGVPDAQVRQRCLPKNQGGENIKQSTKFTDRAKMETAIGDAIDANRPAIDAWLNTDPPAGVNLPAFDHPAKLGDLGTGFRQVPAPGGGPPTIEPIPPGQLQNVRVVLKSDGQGGFIIQTAFPQ